MKQKESVKLRESTNSSKLKPMHDHTKKLYQSFLARQFRANIGLISHQKLAQSNSTAVNRLKDQVAHSQ